MIQIETKQLDWMYYGRKLPLCWHARHEDYEYGCGLIVPNEPYTDVDPYTVITEDAVSDTITLLKLSALHYFSMHFPKEDLLFKSTPNTDYIITDRVCYKNIPTDIVRRKI